MQLMRPRARIGCLLVHATLIQAITFLLRPASTYRALAIDVDPAAVGVIGATFAIAPLVVALPVGRLVNRLGERVLMLTGSLITALAAIVFGLWSSSVAGLLVANAALGFGHLCCIIGQQALVANTARAGRLDTMFGYYTFAASLGQAVGPLLIAALAGSAVQPDTRPIFAAAAIGTAILTLVAFGVDTTVGTATEASRSTKSGLGPLLRTPGLLPALGTSAVVVAAVDLSLIYLPALGTERDLPAAVVGTLLTIRAVFSMGSRILLGRLSRLLGRTRLMVTSLVVSAASLAVVALPLPLWAMAIVLAAMGLGLGVCQPLTMSWLSEQAPPPMRGVALSLRLAGNRLGQVTLPSLMGLVAAGLGAAGVLAGTALTVAGTLVLLRGVRLDSLD